MKVKLLSHTENPEKLVAAAAKLCYSAAEIETLMNNLTEEKIEDFVKRLASMGHESPIEHVTFTFGIEDVSRALLAQITRHRIASYSVQSQRYVDMTDFTYVTPPAIAQNEGLANSYNELMDNLAASYENIKEELVPIIIDNQYNDVMKSVIYEVALSLDLENPKEKSEEIVTYWNKLNECPEDYAKNFYYWREIFLEKFKETYASTYNAIKKIAQEDARFVLPNACTTKLIVTMNARSLLNFYRLRCCSRAQWEIRELACEMLSLTKEVAPLLFKYAGPACVKGKCPEGAMSCGKPFKKD